MGPKHLPTGTKARCPLPDPYTRQRHLHKRDKSRHITLSISNLSTEIRHPEDEESGKDKVHHINTPNDC